MKKIFVKIPKWQDTAPRVTPFCHFLLELSLLSSDRSQILRDVSNESLNVHKFLKIHGVMMDILALVEIFFAEV